MNHWFLLLNILGSAVLVAFGLYVWRVEPGNPRNQAFCLFALGFSLGTALANVENIVGFTGTVLSVEVALRGPLYGLGGIGAGWFGYATVKPDRRTAAWAAVPGAVLVGVFGGMHILGFVDSPYGPLSAAAENIGFLVLLGGCVFGVILFGLAFGRAGGRREARQEWAYLAAALLLYPAFYLTFIAAPPIGSTPTLTSPVAAGLVAVAASGTALVVVGVWVRNTRIPEASSTALHVVLLGVGMGLVGLGLSVIRQDVTMGLFGVPFLARAGAVGILGYAILRGQLMGIDEKVEWGLSRTTVAGIFVAVFFVVSEAAQLLFAGFAGNEFLGVLAAGALVFFIAPLQRLADRVAARAVPGGAEAGADAEERFRMAVDMALADGEIGRGEERRLAERADELGLSHSRARELREQVEDEMGPGGDEA